MDRDKILFWFRRDLRVADNAGLYQALRNSTKVQALFIFDPEILNPLEQKDLRVNFILQELTKIKKKFEESGSGLWVFKDSPLKVFSILMADPSVKAIYTNEDYEPFAIARDSKIRDLAKSFGVEFITFKDQVIFHKDDVVTDSKKSYSIFTPYKGKWLKQLRDIHLKSHPSEKWLHHLFHAKAGAMPSIEDLGFKSCGDFKFSKPNLGTSLLRSYKEQRDFPFLEGTSKVGLHLRFGTVSIRSLVLRGRERSPEWLSELIWREFFMQSLYHFPENVERSYRREFDNVPWRHSKSDLDRWKNGETGFPLVDAGMRELRSTGYMHNRVRMVVASFLTKHLLIHWKEGERHFAKYLLDFELASNIGNWQWAAGSGCDATPYFRIFNPTVQLRKFDPEGIYMRKWIPEFGSSRYPQPIISHEEGRDRCLRAFTKFIGKRRKP